MDQTAHVEPRPIQMRRVVITILLFLALVPVVVIWAIGFLKARGLPKNSKWQQISRHDAAGQDGLKVVSLHLRRGSGEARMTLVEFSASEYELIVVDNGPARGTPRFSSLRDALRLTGCSAGANGGFFDPATFQPNGQMISSGVSTGRFDAGNWAEGLVVVRDGVLSLEERQPFSASGAVAQLLQTGQWLIRHYSQAENFSDDHPARRTFLAEDRRGKWVLGHAAEVTFSDLTEILRSSSMLQVLNIQHALNLDGGPSAGLWVDMPGTGDVHIPEQTVIRNFVGIRRRSPSP